MDIKSMTPAEFVALRRRCIDLVRETVKLEYDKETFLLFNDTAARAELLPFTRSVAETFMGIIGFWNYLQRQGPNPGYFIRDATHDLNECVNHGDKEWYSPRTELYVEFYIPLPVDAAPVNVVTSFFMYMWNRWCEEECSQVFQWNYTHFWNKWCYHVKQFRRGAAECFYAELDVGNRRLLVERACEYYNKNLRITQ